MIKRVPFIRAKGAGEASRRRFRSARSALNSLVPTTTGSATAIMLIAALLSLVMSATGFPVIVFNRFTISTDSVLSAGLPF